MAAPKLWSDGPIIRRADENDVYKILMMYLIWKEYPSLQVKFGFKNRTKTIQVQQYIDSSELHEQLVWTQQLRFGDAEIKAFRSWDMFPEEFLLALRNLKLQMPDYVMSDKELTIETTGNWFQDTLWEIYILAIVSELYAKGMAKSLDLLDTTIWDRGNELLTEKIRLFNQYPGLRIAQFGQRRRLSGPWEEHVTGRLLSECSPGIITGVSNMYLADKFGVPAQGTNAHELPMALTALAAHSGPRAMRQSVFHVLELWQELFGHKSLVMLDDTYGSEFFRNELPRKYLEDFKGFRQDSGDPFEYGEAVVRLYESKGIDPKGRLLIFSDGLKPELIIKLYEHFAGRIMVAFGVGTNLTFDIGHFKALSLVMKIFEAAGNPAVKLSNNLNKGTGPEEVIAYYKEVFGYANTFTEDVVY